MPLPTKTLRTLVAAGTSNAAGNTTTSTTWNLTTALGGILTAKITNGGTGPTVAANLTVKVSGDGSSWKTLSGYPVAAGTAAGASYEWSVPIDPAVMYAQVVFDSNTGQAVTVEAFGQELTAIS